MMSFRTLAAGFLVFVCFVAALDMGAVTIRAMTLADLVRESDLVFIGTVTDSSSAWNAEHSRIYTRTTLV